jgi:DNA-binding MarR family transcriptional regulator
MIKIRKFNNEWREQVLRNWPEALANSTGVMRQLLSAADRLRQSCHPHIAAHGIQPGDFDVLVTLRVAGEPFELSPTTVYRQRCLSSGGLTKILHRLQDAGLVARRSNAEDKRGQLIRLTAKGKRVVEATMRDLAQLEQDVLADFEHNETRLLSDLLDKLRHGIDGQEGE